MLSAKELALSIIDKVTHEYYAKYPDLPFRNLANTELESIARHDRNADLATALYVLEYKNLREIQDSGNSQILFEYVDHEKQVIHRLTVQDLFDVLPINRLYDSYIPKAYLEYHRRFDTLDTCESKMEE